MAEARSEAAREAARREGRRCWRWAVATAGALTLALLPLGGMEGEEGAAMGGGGSGGGRSATGWRWVPQEEGQGTELDARAVRSAAAFALPTPAGFTSRLRTERVELEPSVGMAWPEGEGAAEGLKSWRLAVAEGEGRGEGSHVERWGVQGLVEKERKSVWAAVPTAASEASMQWPEGWDAGSVAGVDGGFAGWGGAGPAGVRGWTASVDVTFGEDGVPVAALVTQGSGDERVDERLSRSVRGWRWKGAAGARRQGVVTWTVPRAAALAAASGMPGAGGMAGAWAAGRGE